MKFAIAASLACLMLAAPLSAETLTNDTIVTLTEAQLGDAAIIAKIKTSDVKFDLSTQQIIALKGKGVSGPVIAAMLAAANPQPSPESALSLTSADPMVPHPAGVYLLKDDAVVRIDPTMTSQAKTGGMIGAALTGGIASMSVKAAIQNETARVGAKGPRPTFYFFFDASNPQIAERGSPWDPGNGPTMVSPAEMTLIELKKKSGRREARVGSRNIAGMKTGVMDKDRIDFDYQMIRPGVFKLTPKGDLKKGEYGFIYSINGGGASGALTARIFDFSVTG